MLGFEPPAQLEVSRLAWDASAILDGWSSAIGPLDFERLTRPTPSRGRSLRNLTVNVFHPFELLPAAFESGWFDWDPTEDEAREAGLHDAASVLDYAAERHLAWRDWLLERDAQLTADPEIDSPRGRVSYSSLLASQRFHAAFHYRQLVAVRADDRCDPGSLFSLGGIGDLVLPPEIF